MPVAVVMDEPSPEAVELAAGFQLSSYFNAQDRSVPWPRPVTHAGEQRERHRADSSGFCAPAHLGESAVQILVNGTDANKARIIQGYAQASGGTLGGAHAAGGLPMDERARSWCKTGSGSTKPTTAITFSSPV